VLVYGDVLHDPFVVNVIKETFDISFQYPLGMMFLREK
jgi:hypothetical protein